MEPPSRLLMFAWEGSLVAECSLNFGLTHLMKNDLCLMPCDAYATEFFYTEFSRRCWIWFLNWFYGPFFFFHPSFFFFLFFLHICSYLVHTLHSSIFCFPSFCFCSFTSSSFSILFLSVLWLPLFLPFSYFLPIRRTLWPLYPLTHSLWACPCHQGVGQEVEAMRKGQVRPSRNASTSPTSLSASETQTYARCLG